MAFNSEGGRKPAFPERAQAGHRRESTGPQYFLRTPTQRVRLRLVRSGDGVTLAH
jgi:hypothetical protein